MWSLGMILHKLIFFRLPYRWAAYGDRPGLYGSDAKSLNEDDEGGNDTDRLEREVSSYPGFESTARLETLFTSRRLPRSYLVLLESLLNVSPAARPTCEKVLAALHLGKVCPLIIRFSQAHNWFVVQPHSAEIEHVRCSFTKDGTGIRCRLHLIIDPSTSRADNFIATFITHTAPITVVTTNYHFKRSFSNTAACKIRREDPAVLAYMVKVKLAWVMVCTSEVGHGRAGATCVQVWRSCSQNCIALRQQRCLADMGAVGARWAEYCRFAVRQRRFEPGVWRRTCLCAESIYYALSGGVTGYGIFCFTSH